MIAHDCDGFQPTTDFDDLLSPSEAIDLLRLDELGVRDPRESLRYLRRTRQLGYVKVAGRVLYTRRAIFAYLQRHAVEAIP
jgi:hypothetical protein